MLRFDFIMRGCGHPRSRSTSYCSLISVQHFLRRAVYSSRGPPSEQPWGPPGWAQTPLQAALGALGWARPNETCSRYCLNQTVTGCKFHLAGSAQGRQGHCGEGVVAHSGAAGTQDGISTVFLKPKAGRSKILEQLHPYPTPPPTLGARIQL